MPDINKVYKFRALALRPIFVKMDQRCVNRSQLAKKYGTSRSMLYQYQHGITPIPQKFLDWLLSELDLPADTVPSEMRELILSQKIAKGA